MTSLTHAGISRRQAVAALGLGGFAVTLVPLSAEATPDSAKKLLGELVKAAPQAGKIEIKTQEIAENGNTVPVRISVDSPMNDKDYVTQIQVGPEQNSSPRVPRLLPTPA